MPDHLDEEKEIKQGSPTMLLLPEDVISKVSDFLTGRELAIFSSTCKTLETSVKKMKNDKDDKDDVWREKIKQDFQRTVPAKIKEPLSNKTIYRHLAMLSKQPDYIQRWYSDAEPALFQATLNGDLTGVDYYFCLEKAAQVGNMALVQWLMAKERGTQRTNPNQTTLDQIVEVGHRELEQWLMEEARGTQRVNPNQSTLDLATESGNMALVQCMMAKERGDQQANPNQFALTLVASSGNTALAKWLMAKERGDQRVNPNQITLNLAARLGNTALVQWLMAKERGAQRVNPNQITLNLAARLGNTALLQWLMAKERGAQRVNPNQFTVAMAIISGNTALAQWLMSAARGDQQVNPNQTTLNRAAKSGNTALALWIMHKLSMTFFQKWRHLPYQWHVMFIGILLVGLALAILPFTFSSVFQLVLLIPSYLTLPMTILGGLTTALSGFLYIKKINKIQPPDPEGEMERHDRGVDDQNGIGENKNDGERVYMYSMAARYSLVAEQAREIAQNNLNRLLDENPALARPSSPSAGGRQGFLPPPEVKGSRPSSSSQSVSSSASVAQSAQP